MLIELYLSIAALVLSLLSFCWSAWVAYRQVQVFEEVDDLQIQINFLNTKIEEVKQLEQITTDF